MIEKRGARGKALATIFTIINEETHKPVENPVKRIPHRSYLMIDK